MSRARRLPLRLTAGLAAAFMATCVLSQGAPKEPGRTVGRFSFNGVGTHSCGLYLENVKGLQAETWKLLYQQWGAGFMAGTSNEGRASNVYTDLETYTAWLDKWCAEDPSSKVAIGIIALGKRLSSQK